MFIQSFNDYDLFPSKVGFFIFNAGTKELQGQKRVRGGDRLNECIRTVLFGILHEFAKYSICIDVQEPPSAKSWFQAINQGLQLPIEFQCYVVEILNAAWLPFAV